MPGQLQSFKKLLTTDFGPEIVWLSALIIIESRIEFWVCLNVTVGTVISVTLALVTYSRTPLIQI